MKVLKIKDKNAFASVKRGVQHIIPVIDNNGNWIVGLEILQDPVYADLVEDLLDACELIEHEPLKVAEPAAQDTPAKQVKGEFKALMEQEKDLETAAEKYYQSKRVKG